MSEEARSEAIERVFTSPLQHARGMRGVRGGGEQAREERGGLLMEALMGRDSASVAASLLRRAKGEEAQWEREERDAGIWTTSKKLDDGWVGDEDVALLLRCGWVGGWLGGWLCSSAVLVHSLYLLY